MESGVNVFLVSSTIAKQTNSVIQKAKTHFRFKRGFISGIKAKWKVKVKRNVT